MTRNKVTTILIAVCVIMHFCVVNDIVRPHFFVTTVAYPLLAFYFFPLAVILDSIKLKEKREVLYSLMSGFVFSSILCFSLVHLLLPDNQIVHKVLRVFSLINAVLIYVLLFVKNDKYRAFGHVLFCFFQ
jgi:hypothetical protein